MDNIYKKEYIQKKAERREKKRTDKRKATAHEVLFIFEKILEGWKTIRIYNTIIQTNPKTDVDKKWVEKISTGNCKVYENELSSELYQSYLDLRQKVYQFHDSIKNETT